MNKQIIRNWSQSDIPALAKYLNNKKIWDNCRDSLPYPYTEEDAARFIESTKCQDDSITTASKSMEKPQAI